MKPGGSEEAGIMKFKEIVEAKSNGRMNVKVFMSGQLGKEKAVLELMKIGQTQMALTGGIFRTMFAKEYDPITIPFYLPNWQAVKSYMEGPLGKKIGQLAEEKGGVIDFGPQKRAARHMTTNRKITTPDDINGLRMRLPAIPIWVDVWKELGALPTVIPAPEIYLAMKTGQVDAHENSLVSPYSRKLWEVQDYIILTGHVYFPWHWIASKAWFDKLAPADQTLIRQAIDEARAYGDKVEDEKDAFYAAELKKKGMKFITPDNKAIRAKAMPAIKRAVANLAPEVAVEIERLAK
ncbi:MAG: TRAP transporter substrate-binding protein [Desulfobacterales bacterium]|nr:TRAP transporter substrate-binding protein [Desulfobacterales bacterium]